MVGSVCYGSAGATWDRGTRGASGGGVKKAHAEVEAYEARRLEQGHTVFLFVQDEYPCRDPGHDCDGYFRRASNPGRLSFIFRVTASGGYGPPALLQARPMPVLGVGQGAERVFHEAMQAYKREIAAGRQYVPVTGVVALPATLYYHRGSAYLNAAPQGFPAHPGFAHL